MNLMVRTNMFTAKQMAYVISPVNQEVKASYAISTNTMAGDILRICEDQKLNSVTLIGPTIYTKGIAEKIREAESVKYNTHKINIYFEK